MTTDNSVLQWQGRRLDFSEGTIIMGILNVTPDSFSDGGMWLDKSRAVEHGIQMAEAGAAIIDIGPESTRPGAEPVGINEQIKRAVPVIEELVGRIDIPLSIDSRDYEVVAASVKAGASIVNDVTALADERTMHLAAETGLPVVLMHMKGMPRTMQLQPEYDNVVTEVLEFLVQRAKLCESEGIDASKIFIDPGIGFGKTIEHNLELLRNIKEFVNTGYRVLLGTSRKKFLGTLTGRKIAPERMFGTAATVALAVQAGVSIVRVHDVEAMADVVKVANAICRH